MRLDQMTVALRVRSPWQAMDLGLRMVRANARAIWVPYFQFAGSVFVACNLFAYLIDQLWLGWLLIWWLKPMFDRIPLHVLSHVTFGSHPTRRDTLRAPFKWRIGLLLSWLTYRRFSFWRSMSIPIDVLEDLNNERLSRRRSVLIGAVSAQMMGLSLVCLFFELVFYSSFIVLFYMFVPTEYLEKLIQNSYSEIFVNAPKWASLAFNTIYFLSVALISPFYVGAGFAVYLNRRTQLEAWDIEIAFKRIADRLKQASTAITLLGVLLCSGGFFADSFAADAPKNEPKPKTLPQLFGDHYQAEPKSISEAVKKAYRDKDLSPKAKTTVWEPKKKPKETKKTQEFTGMEKLFDAVQGVVSFFAEYGLWGLLAILLSVLIWKARHWMPWVKDQLPAKRVLDALSEKEILNLESLPGDLSSAVRQLWAQQPRAALALLYRASVQKLADRLGVPFPPGATEAECLRRCGRLSQPESEAVFKKVVRAWQAAAYAHRLPNNEEFESLLGEWSVRWEKGV
jgi:hypothetical protein